MRPVPCGAHARGARVCGRTMTSSKTRRKRGGYPGGSGNRIHRQAVLTFTLSVPTSGSLICSFSPRGCRGRNTVRLTLSSRTWWGLAVGSAGSTSVRCLSDRPKVQMLHESVDRCALSPSRLAITPSLFRHRRWMKSVSWISSSGCAPSNTSDFDSKSFMPSRRG